MRAYLSAGSNLGDRIANLDRAIGLIAGLDGVDVIAVSSYYETEPVGFADQPDFMNCAVGIETTLDPHQLLEALLHIEKSMGRTRSVRWGPRLIDIDILIYEGLSIRTDELEIPHPRMTERAFVMVPLAEIAPGLAAGDAIPGADTVRRLTGRHSIDISCRADVRAE